VVHDPYARRRSLYRGLVTPSCPVIALAKTEAESEGGWLARGE
jgi:hypothetical protein